MIRSQQNLFWMFAYVDVKFLLDDTRRLDGKKIKEAKEKKDEDNALMWIYGDSCHPPAHSFVANLVAAYLKDTIADIGNVMRNEFKEMEQCLKKSVNH